MASLEPMWRYLSQGTNHPPYGLSQNAGVTPDSSLDGSQPPPPTRCQVQQNPPTSEMCPQLNTSHLDHQVPARSVVAQQPDTPLQKPQTQRSKSYTFPSHWGQNLSFSLLTEKPSSILLLFLELLLLPRFPLHLLLTAFHLFLEYPMLSDAPRSFPSAWDAFPLCFHTISLVIQVSGQMSPSQNPSGDHPPLHRVILL